MNKWLYVNRKNSLHGYDTQLTESEGVTKDNPCKQKIKESRSSSTCNRQNNSKLQKNDHY